MGLIKPIEARAAFVGSLDSSISTMFEYDQQSSILTYVDR